MRLFCENYLLPFVVFIFFFSTINAKKIQLKPLVNFHKGEQEFKNGNCKSAVEFLKAINIPIDLESPEHIREAYKMLAICQMQLGKENEAKDTLADLLFLEPDYEFDPFDTPLAVIELYKKQKEDIQRKNEEIKSIKKELIPVEKKTEINAKVELPKTIFAETTTNNHKGSVIYSFLPFGLGHLYEGHKTKALIYGSLEASFLFLNISSFWWKQSYLASYGQNRLGDEKNRQKFHSAQTIQYIALGGVLLTYVISLMDSFFQNHA